jgi:hypothetical protein
MRKILVLMAAALAAIGTLTPAVSPAGARGTLAAAPYCGITWGSLAKTAPGFTGAPITNLRAGRHTCYDRLVVDLRGRVAGYDVRYVPVVVLDGSGDALPVAGGADLQVVVQANGFDPVTGVSTYSPADRFHAVNVAGYSTFRQVAYAGTYEGYTTIALGVRARLPFRVFVLAGPGTGSRLVIDVAHRW